jgi:hypothetical protein
MGNGAMDRLKDRVQTQDVATTQTGQDLLEQGQTVRQMRLENYMTAVAVQKARDKRLVIREVEFEAELLGEKAYYSWTAKGKRGRALVEGPSVDLAMVLCREWGNCASRADLVAETETHYLFDGVFLDLERGVTVIRQFRQVKEREMGRMDKERAEDIVFQVGQSKALRNAVVAAMPAWLVDKALKKAKAAAARDMTPEKVIEAFARWDVDQKTLERKLGKAAKRWDLVEMSELRGIYQSILDGMSTIDNEFGDEQAAAAVADATLEKVDPETGEVTPAEDQGKEAPPAEEAKPPAEEAPPPKEEAKTPETGDVTPAAKKAIEAFSAHKVTREQLEAKMEKPATEWKRGELSKLKAMIKSIDAKDVAVADLFPAAKDGEDDGGSWDD